MYVHYIIHGLFVNKVHVLQTFNKTLFKERRFAEFRKKQKTKKRMEIYFHQQRLGAEFTGIVYDF